MKSVWLLMIALSLSVCACSRKVHSEVKPSPDDNQPRAVKPEEAEIKGASPEDPGPAATVVVPLEVLKKQAKSTSADTPEEPPQKSLPIDHPVYLDPQVPKHFLHKVFSLNNHTQFAFQVPPHQGNARLRGTFRSFTQRSAPDSTSDRTAALDLLLLNDEEFNEFLHGRPQSVTYELDSANNQRVDWRVPTTYGEAETYHLVFTNAADGTKAKFVEADFTVSFE